MTETSITELAHRARGRAAARRLNAWATDEAGDTMIEVVIATLIVALLAVAIFTGFGAVSQIAGAQRHESVAIQFAQQDEQRLRGLSVPELIASGATGATSPGTAGNESYYLNLNGEQYLITSTAKFVTAKTGGLSCSTSGAGSADYISTTSTVTWANNNDGRKPVEEHSLVTPVTGGVIVASVQDDYPNNGAFSDVPGATVEIQGPGSSGSTITLDTDSNGCVVDAGLSAGTYVVTAVPPAGYILSGSATQSVSLANGGSETAAFFADPPGTVDAQFDTVVNGSTGAAGSVPFDTFSLTENGVTNGYGVAGTLATSVSSGATVYPAPSGSYPLDYLAYAGNCTADGPTGATGTTSETSVAVSPGGTTPITITMPSMLFSLATQSTGAAGTFDVDDPAGTYTNAANGTSATVAYGGSSWTHHSGSTYSNDYDSTESDDTGTVGDYVELTFTGTSITLVGKTTSSSGYLNVYLISGSNSTLEQANVNFYSGTTKYKQSLYTYTAPSYGTYTLEFYVDGAHQTGFGGSTGNAVAIDEFEIAYPGTTTTTPITSGTLPYTVSTFDSCPTAVKRTLTSTIASTSVSGSIVYPVAAPYGTSLQVCFANTVSGQTTNTGELPSSGNQLSNIDYTGTTITSLTLPTTTGATGASAVFDDSGGC